MNPMNMIKTFMNTGGTPQQFILKALEKNTNPIFTNLLSMAKKGDNESIEKFARNYCKENGMDFDKDFNKFMEMVKKNS